MTTLGRAARFRVKPWKCPFHLDFNPDSLHLRERIPDPLPALIQFAQRRHAECLRLRSTGAPAVPQVGSERRDRRLLAGPEAQTCIPALREAAGLDSSSAWAAGRLAWSGGPLTVEVRLCLVGERALVRFQPPKEPDPAAASARLQLQDPLIEAVQRNRNGFLGDAGPECALALLLAIESADLLCLVEAACDRALLAAAAEHDEAWELARAAGRALALLMQAGQTEAAALLVREARNLPAPETASSSRCRRLLVAPLLSAGVHLPDRRELPFLPGLLDSHFPPCRNSNTDRHS